MQTRKECNSYCKHCFLMHAVRSYVCYSCFQTLSGDVILLDPSTQEEYTSTVRHTPLKDHLQCSQTHNKCVVLVSFQPPNPPPPPMWCMTCEKCCHCQYIFKYLVSISIWLHTEQKLLFSPYRWCHYQLIYLCDTWWRLDRLPPTLYMFATHLL